MSEQTEDGAVEDLLCYIETLEAERDTLAARVVEAEKIIEGWVMSPQTTQATWDAIRELGKWFTEAPDK